ncbi:(2Fe-2S)-binding protein [Streptomyces bungoensis]|uniref:(2Fe-2S)-binding protein n=1 Tax=Streptomyces bungoensis TaxID=285568 RepID=A0A101T0C5_9ACTN|nr:2Fe-2S iron-sulfur cluster-binding protein [Streptomyces bungoensis]KUN83209.1 (2Fe-2S)-binding protein [Streptomyces bungoensis]
MTDDQHGEGTPQGGGRWDPLPQGDYDDGATAFVKLPEGGIDALLSGDSPLAAPGHGYVPPRITPAPGAGEPDGGGAWAAPGGGEQWPDPNAVPPGPAGGDRFTYQPAATQQWTFEEPAAPPAPGHDVTGQWSIPVAGGDLPDESGEFTTSALVEQWGGTPPATLPGGASAPWATEPPGQPWGRPEQEPARPEPRRDHPFAAAPPGHPADPAGTAPGAPDGLYAGSPADGAGPADPAEDGATASGRGPEEAGPETGGTPAGTADDSDPAQAAEGPAGGPADHGPATGTGPAHEAAQPPVTADAPPTADPAATDGPAEPAGSEDAPDAADPEDPATRAGEDHATAAHETPADAPDPEDPAPLPPHDEHPLASYVLRVNGADRPVTDAWIGESLLYVLRERLGLAGAKDGCSQGECGACNVQVDGRLVASCLVPAVTAAGSEVRTVEGLAVDGQPSDVQRALARCGAVQCGFCVPGMAMTLHDLLEGNPAPTELETRQALCGNLCRCSGYRGVLRAVQEVVAEREAHTGADAGTDTDEPRIPHQAGPGAGGVNPSAFDTHATHGHGVFDSPHTFGTPGPHDQHHGQDGGQA